MAQLLDFSWRGLGAAWPPPPGPPSTLPTPTPTPRAEIRPAQLSDVEIRRLCTSPQDVFLNQPNVLELDAPIKVCGKGARFLPNLLPMAPLGKAGRSAAQEEERRRARIL
ncbi:hypothetical protein ZWY2020_007454 [Hordeum vulgare]|nr:hypothetical protein ZWY2020_007454 [Hordeum vulgare]